MALPSANRKTIVKPQSSLPKRKRQKQWQPKRSQKLHLPRLLEQLRKQKLPSESNNPKSLGSSGFFVPLPPLYRPCPLAKPETGCILQLCAFGHVRGKECSRVFVDVDHLFRAIKYRRLAH